MVLLDRDGHGSNVPHAQRNFAIHRIRGRQARDGILVGQGGNGPSHHIQGEERALLKKRPLAQGLFRGAQERRKSVGELRKRPSQKRE